MSLYQREGVWWVSLYHKGQPRIRCSAETAEKQKAKEFHDRIKDQLWRNAKLGEPIVEIRTWADACKLWLKDAERGDEDKYRLTWLRAEIGDGTNLSSLTNVFINDVLDRKPDAAPATRNRYINLIVAVMNLASDRWALPRPPKVKRRKVGKGRLRWLTGDEWARLQAQLPAHLLAMARFAIATGLRENNVIWLEWSQVDIARSTAWIHPDQAKGGESIGVPLSKDALAVLKVQLKAKDKHERWVFPFEGDCITRASNHAWRKAKERAKVLNFTWHGLRHTWASWHVMNGTRLEELQQLGAWKSISQVQIYAHLAPSHLTRFVGNAKPVDLVTKKARRKTENTVSA